MCTRARNLGEVAGRMEIIRFVTAGSAAPRVGVAEGERVTELPVASVAGLLAQPLASIRRSCEEAAGPAAAGPVHDRADVRLLAPVDGRTDVWAAGVTYELSQQERMKESAGAA